MDYKIPALDPKLRTTGALKNIDKPKTIYDPKVWTDDKLEKALKESIQDVSNKSKLFIESPTIGLTSEGYGIVFTTNNGKVTSFWFD